MLNCDDLDTAQITGLDRDIENIFPNRGNPDESETEEHYKTGTKANSKAAEGIS